MADLAFSSPCYLQLLRPASLTSNTQPAQASQPTQTSQPTRILQEVGCIAVPLEADFPPSLNAAKTQSHQEPNCFEKAGSKKEGQGRLRLPEPTQGHLARWEQNRQPDCARAPPATTPEEHPSHAIRPPPSVISRSHFRERKQKKKERRKKKEKAMNFRSKD